MSSDLPVIITIDGPSGAGKGTLARKLAEHTGYHLLDSGALYRIVGLAAVQQQADFTDGEALGRLARGLDINFVVQPGGIAVKLDGNDVSEAIRTESAGMNASKVAAVPDVRAALLDLQRDFATAPGLIADGRDLSLIHI